MTRKRALAVLAAVLALVMLFSVLYIAVEADHDCHGDDCAICAQISVCMDLLQHLALALLMIAVAAVLRLSALQIRKAVSFACHRVSLISLKVKLTD